MLRPSEAIQRFTRQRIQQANVRISHDKPACRSGGDGCLHREHYGVAGGRLQRGELAHCLLHGQGGPGSGQAGALTAKGRIVVDKPACNCVAGKRHDAAAKSVNFVDDGVIDEIQIDCECFGSPLGAKLAYERFGQLCKAGDVGKQCRPVLPVGQRTAGNHRMPAIHRHVDN